MEGIINLYKTAGMTSHDCVFKLRKILQTKKIGHGGTLDPDVEGVLPICVGRGTKVIEYMVDSGKTYQGEITFGFSTTTEDASGEIVHQELLASPITDEKIKEMMAEFCGDQIQIPPMYSAVRVNGKKLYEYARKNQTVERPKRQISIYDFKMIGESVFEAGLQRFSFEVVCSKGTYVRTLAVDLGKRLGLESHMSHLKRTMAADLSIENALTLTEIAEKVESGDYSFLQPIELGVKNLSKFEASQTQYEQLQHGAKFLLTDFSLDEAPKKPIAVFYRDKLVAIYMGHPEKKEFLKPAKILAIQ